VQDFDDAVQQAIHRVQPRALTEQAVHWARDLRPSAFYGTPSYALHFAETARREGIDPAGLGFRVLFFSGEPGAGIPATRALIERTFGGTCVDMGSMAEMSPWMTNGECAHRTGMHLWQDLVYTQVCDPETFRPCPTAPRARPCTLTSSGPPSP